MRKVLRNARFVIPMWPSIGLLVLTTFGMGIQIAVSNGTTVRTAGAICKIEDPYTTGKGIGLKLSCDELGRATRTNIEDPAMVLSVLRNQTTSITCDVMESGRAARCW